MIRLVFAFLILASVAAGQAITGVSGTVSTGESITVTGTGFGATGPGAPTVLERFDNGVAETRLDSTVFDYTWVCDGVGAADPVRYSDDYQRSGSGLAARAINPDRSSGTERADHAQVHGLDIGLSEKFYILMYWKSNYDGCKVDSDADAPVSWKPWRVTYGTTGGYPTIAPEWQSVTPTPPGVGMIFAKSSVGSNTIESTGLITGGVVPDTSYWWMWEGEYKGNTSSGAGDGVWNMWAMQEETGRSWSKLENNINLWTSGDPTDRLYGSFNMYNYIRGANSTDPQRHYRIYMDDLVITKGSGAWSRLMLGNAPTWGGCTMREYLPITSWSDTSITATVFTGQFEAESNAWLYAVTEDGAGTGGGVSSGYPVEIGAAGGGLSPPGQPTVNRTGSTATVSWTASNPAPTLGYQIEVIEATGLRHVRTVPPTTLTCDIEVGASAQLRTSVSAVDTSGSVQSRSQERVTAGS